MLLYRKKIDCTLACGGKAQFQGIGIAIVELQPDVFVTLAPCYLSEPDDVCTISPGALKRYSKCKEARHEALDYLIVTTSENVTTKLKLKTAAGLDYVQLLVHHYKRPLTSKSERNPHLVVKPRLVFKGSVPSDPDETLDEPKISATEADEIARDMKRMAEAYPTRKDLDYQLSMYLHMKFGHCSMDYVRKLIQKGRIKGLPAKVLDLKFDCPLCKIASAPKLPRGSLVDHTQTRKGVQFHMDYAIFNVLSKRGHKAALLCTEVTSRLKMGYPVQSRSPPLEIVRTFVLRMRQQGYPVSVIRVDEEGGLARSANFMQLCVQELQINVQTTGGYNSENNGMVESPIKPIKRMVRVMLIGAALPNELWCYAFVYAVWIANHSYNRMIDDMPIVKWYDGNYEVKASDLHLFGSKVYCVKNAEHKKQLQPRTEKDPRDYIGLTVDEDELGDKHVDGFLVGNAGHSTVKLVYDPETAKVLRCHHCYIDECCVRVLPGEKLTPNAVILQDLPTSVRRDDGVIDPMKIKLVKVDFEETNERVDPEECVTLSFTLPEKGVSIGLKFESDTVYGFPILSKVTPQSYLRSQIPADLHKNCWIIAINSDEHGYVEPISAKFCHDEIVKCQRKNCTTSVELTFCRRIKPINTEIETYRQVSDQMERPQPLERGNQAIDSPQVNHVASEDTIWSSFDSPLVNHIASLPVRPPLPGKGTIWDCLDGPHREHWIAGLHSQYEKNANNKVLSAPIPKEDLPEGTKVYQSIMACSIKEKGQGLWKFVTRHCLNGSKMQQGSDFDFSYSPTISYAALRLLLAYSAAKSRRLSIVDVENCFQNGVIPHEDRVYVTTPPHYIPWFKQTFPGVPLKNAKNYVLQTLNGMQGRKDAGRTWYLSLCRMLEDFGLIPSPFEPALFVLNDGHESLIVVTSTDDFICSYTHDNVFSAFLTHMEKFVPITTQDGTVLKYLNLRIVQSDLGISFDQTHHIQTTIVDEAFPAGRDELVKTADTPYRTDAEYEKALHERLPATPEELQVLEKKHGGKFNALIGKYMHIYNATRFDLGFAVTRLAQFNCAPNEPAFDGINRMARYLMTHLHTPVFYPNLDLRGYQSIRWEPEPGKAIEFVMSNMLEMGVDSDHARDIKTRKSVSSIIVYLLGVAVHWHMGKQSCVAAHSTDAEIRAFYSAMLTNRAIRPICEFMGIPNRGPTPIHEDNQPAIDIMVAGQITSRVKHMAIPVKMIAEDIEMKRVEPKKISGLINSPDIGTKPLPAQSHHRFFRQLRGQRFYPDPSTEHGKLMQVDMVSHRLTEFDSQGASKIDPHRMQHKSAVYDNKDKASPKEDDSSKGNGSS